MQYPIWHHLGFKIVCSFFMLRMYHIADEKYQQNSVIIKRLENIEYVLKAKPK